MKFFFFTPPAFSESLYFLFSYRSLYFSFRYFLVISRRISNNLFFDQLPGFVCFLCSGFFRFEKWNETYVFGGLYLLYLESFKYEPFRLLCFVLSFFLMSLLYAISPILSTCFQKYFYLFYYCQLIVVFYIIIQIILSVSILCILLDFSAPDFYSARIPHLPACAD